jgi:hypothetical protein
MKTVINCLKKGCIAGVLKSNHAVLAPEARKQTCTDRQTKDAK